MTTDRLIIFDTTLRDGEQSPGCSMNLEEKLRMAQLLDQMGVDVIEAGFPIASKGDFEAVQAIARLIKESVVCGLCRAKDGDIEAAAEALKPAEKRRIHTFLSTSPLHMKYKLQMAPDAVLDLVRASVTKARQYTDDIEWSAEDGSRTEDDFLCRAVEIAIKAGATTINIPDTVGYTLPAEYAAKFRMLRARVPNMDKAVLSVHCHNDLGLAVANTLAGIEAGARQIECTINGIGERAGNAALEEVVMAVRTRPDLLKYENRIQTPMITRASRTLSAITGVSVQPNKAIVGANAFAHESGIHQDGMLKNAQTYEIMTPDSVGLTKSELVLGKHSGRAAFKSKLADLGYVLGDNALEEAFSRFKDLADRKKEIFDEDIFALVDDQSVKSLRPQDRLTFVGLTVQAGSRGPQVADLELSVDGRAQMATSRGNGPVDAIFTAIRKIYPHDAKLQLYKVHAVTGGTDAQARVTVQLEQDGTVFNGQSAHADTMVASCSAYLHALNRPDRKARPRPAAGDGALMRYPFLNSLPRRGRVGRGGYGLRKLGSATPSPTPPLWGGALKMNILLIAISLGALACTLCGGLFAIRFKDKLHLILGFSAGAVIGVAFFDLMPEAIALGGRIHGIQAMTGIVALGFLAYLLLDRLTTFHVVADDHHHGHGHDHGANRRGLLGAGSLSIHSFLDGAAIGLAFQASAQVGLIVALAVLAHDFSDGINTVNLVLKNGGDKRQALRWLAIDAAAPVLGVFSTLFFTVPPATLGMVLAVFCGFFLYIGASDLLPESYHRHSTFWTTLSTLLGAAVLYLAVHIAAI